MNGPVKFHIRPQTAKKGTMYPQNISTINKDTNLVLHKLPTKFMREPFIIERSGMLNPKIRTVIRKKQLLAFGTVKPRPSHQ